MNEITYYITLDQLPFLEPWLREHGVPFRSERYIGSFDRPYAKIQFSEDRRETVQQGLREIDPQVKAARPRNPVFVVHFVEKGGDQDGICAVGAKSAEEALEIAAQKLSGLADFRRYSSPGATAEAVDAEALEDHEQQTGDPLPTHSYPAEGEVILLDLGT